MGESDTIIRDKVVSRDNVAISISEVYQRIRDYLKKQKKYTKFNEKCYEEGVKDGLKSTKIILESKKKIDDYTEFKMELKINMKNYKVASVKGKKVAKGDLKIEFSASLENDYKDKWEKGVFNKFLRGCYDKFILHSHFNKLSDEIKEECLDLVDAVKEYLNMIKER